ncbi:hypothetical protein V5O48_016460 [Marasmius crinis-equi]|uniref:Uncharacterized protein n=1 Tax=Marasmius crinis-equi TaxID=585013 RepID=A0ABR3ERY6_9AGAR
MVQSKEKEPAQSDRRTRASTKCKDIPESAEKDELNDELEDPKPHTKKPKKTGGKGGKGSNKTSRIDWTDDLPFELLNTVTDDLTLKKVLFPGVGQNASYSKGGGMTKKEAHWLTAVALFESKAEFSTDIATAKEKGSAALRTLE